MPVQSLEHAYRTITVRRKNLKELLDQGQLLFRMGSLTKIKSPLKGYTVRYAKTRTFIDYYVFNTGEECVAQFSIEQPLKSLPKGMFKPRVFQGTPHLSIREDYQGKGLAKFMYLSFLLGQRVFVTASHTLGAKSVWDSLAKRPDMLSIFVSSKSYQLTHPTSPGALRVLGRKDLFNLSNNTFEQEADNGYS